jgi:hypothetical protein
MVDSPSTPDSVSARKQLQEAIEAYLQVRGWNDGVLTSWVVVGHLQSFDDDGDDTSSYPIIYMNESQPDHVVLGLFDVARDNIRGVGRWADTDDEG